MRAFVAIELNDVARSAATTWSERLRENTAPGALALVRPESLHLTLKFLGNVLDDDAPALSGAIESAVRDLPAFDLSLVGLGAFPSAQRVRVIWIGAGEGSAQCRELAARIESALVSVGCAPSDKAFSPHLTLARVKQPAKARGLTPLLRDRANDAVATIRVDAVTLFRSELLPQGAKHTAVSVARLAEPG